MHTAFRLSGEVETGESRTVAILGARFADLSVEREILGPLGVEFVCGPGASREEIVGLAGEAEVVLCGSAPALDAATLDGLACRGIVRYGIGLERVDLEAAARRGIWVANVPDAGTESVAVHTLTLVLASIRRVRKADRSLREGVWGIEGLRPLRLPAAQVAGVVGFGRIGRRTADMLSCVGFRVLAHDPFVEVEAPSVEPAGFERVLADSDVVCLHMPGTLDARPLLAEAELGRMKADSILVNTARGSLVDAEALARGLEAGRPGFAALDVFPSEPPDLAVFASVSDRMLLTPHMAWYTEESETEVRRKAAEEAHRILLGLPPLNAVAGPDPTPERGRS